MDIVQILDTQRTSLFTVDDLEVEILPLIYEIIRSVEKDPYDSNQKVKESQDTSYKIVDLQKKLDSARGQVKKLQGVEYSKEDQLQNLENLRNQLKLKRELLLKYRNMCSFDMFKI
ncbi:mediator of RNA polymerase II transcription subunit 9 isoform X1 [Leptopilina boulardi]|uniref:mediator of RNA polymerase II transcription subunit 9 isoform X1 n=1 Tax=Leptopilina boulardi TaxID=63433 RepID=UPI0021F5A7F8|nr:mediator of RNA polymerase II transcription subunit 9 isoform X1 [Leptopilina boulardi]